MSRRDFLQSTAKATAALSLLSAAPFVALGRVLGANDTIGVGFIGVGGRGSSHIATVRRLIQSGEKVKIVAVCDAYRYRLDETAKATGAKASTVLPDCLRVKTRATTAPALTVHRRLAA